MFLYSTHSPQHFKNIKSFVPSNRKENPTLFFFFDWVHNIQNNSKEAKEGEKRLRVLRNSVSHKNTTLLVPRIYWYSYGGLKAPGLQSGFFSLTSLQTNRQTCGHCRIMDSCLQCAGTLTSFISQSPICFLLLTFISISPCSCG